MSLIGKILLVAAIFVVVPAVAYVAGQIVGPPHLPVERQQVAGLHQTPSPAVSPVARTRRSQVLPAGTTSTSAVPSAPDTHRSRAQHASRPRRTASPTPASASPTPTRSAKPAATPAPTPTSSPTPTASPTYTSSPTPTESSSPTPSPTSTGTPSSTETSASSPAG